MRHFWVLGSGALYFDAVIVGLVVAIVIVIVVARGFEGSGLLCSDFVRCWIVWLEFGAAVLQLKDSGSECLHSEVGGLDFACLCYEREHSDPVIRDSVALSFACLGSARSCSMLDDCLDIE